MPDDGLINQKIIAKLGKKDFLEKLESGFVPLPVRLYTPEMKRYFYRYFDITQRNIHFIEEICRTRLSHDLVVTAEEVLQKFLNETIQGIDKNIAASEELLLLNGITEFADFLAQALNITARVISPLSSDYLDLFIKTDHFLRLQRTLKIRKLIKSEEQDSQRVHAKRNLRRVHARSRELAIGLRKYMSRTAISAGPVPDSASHHRSP